MARAARKRHTRKQRRRTSSVLKWGSEAVARHRSRSGRTGGAHFKKRGSGRTLSSSLRLKLDRLEKENRSLRKERGQQARRIYHLRIEIGELVRQVKEMKDDDRTKETLRKQVTGCNKTIRSERYIHGEQMARIQQVPCDDEDCECCKRLRAALPSGGPFRSSEQGEVG